MSITPVPLLFFENTKYPKVTRAHAWRISGRGARSILFCSNSRPILPALWHIELSTCAIKSAAFFRRFNLFWPESDSRTCSRKYFWLHSKLITASQWKNGDHNFRGADLSPDARYDPRPGSGSLARARYTYHNNDSSPVAISVKSVIWCRHSKSRSNLDWVTLPFVWTSDSEWGTVFK
jgi:hypothetical protein